MPYNRTRKAYTRKPPSGVKPNLAHPLARGLKLFIPFTEGAGVPKAWVNGILREPSTSSLHSSAGWEIHSQRLMFRPSTTASNSYLVWNSWNPDVGTGDFESVLSFQKIKDGGVGDYAAGIGTYAPGLIATYGVTQYYYYWGGNKIITNYSHNDAEFTVGSISRSGSSVDAEPTRDRAATRGLNNFTHAQSIADGNTYTVNAADATGGFNGIDNFAHYYHAFWNRKLSDAEREMLYHNPEAIWQLYSRPLPIWIPSGAAPPAWNNTMNEIAAPGAVNEITNANIQSVNEI